MSTVIYPHIEFTDQGVPLIAGTTTKVIEVALDRIAHHWSADEIHRQHPHLSLAQIHAALSYYYDHQTQFDAEISSQLDEIDRIKQGIDDSAIREKCGRQIEKSDTQVGAGTFPDRVRLPENCTRPAAWENADEGPEWDPEIHEARLAVERFYEAEDADTSSS